MIRSREVIPPHLQHAMIATRIVAALEGYQGPNSTAGIKPALCDAVTFLDKILEGEKCTEGLLLSETSYESALAYGEAMRVLDESPAGWAALGDEFLQIVHSLRRVVDDISGHERPVPPESLNALKTFFRYIRDVALSSEERPLEKVALLA